MSRFKFSVKHVEAYIAVVDLGTFRRAADRLNTTQPNISNRIAQLEAYVGQRLMERDAGSVRLTAHGTALLEPARLILSAADGFIAAIGDTSKFEGVLRLGVSEMVAHSWLRQFLCAMKTRFPTIDIDLTVDMSVTLSNGLFRRDLDLTLQNGPFDRDAHRTEPLGQSAHVWVAAPSLGLPDRVLTPPEITSHAILAHSRNSTAYRQIKDHFSTIGQPARLVSSTYIGSFLQMALDGLGIACLPAAMLTESLEDGRLQTVNYPFIPNNLKFFARYMAHPAPTYLQEAVAVAQLIFPPDQNAE
jgi:DNA-binding transcriptional LysR family regulator